MSARRRALLVAADEFTDPDLDGLRSPQSDVSAMKEVLADPARGDFEIAGTLVNQASHVVSERIERFFADAAGTELLLLYISCHGLTRGGQSLHFAMPDTHLDALISTSVKASDIKAMMRSSPARGIAIVLDCCHAGLFGRDADMKGIETEAHVDDLQDEGRGHVVLAASNEIEYAHDGQRTHDLETPTCSKFTEAIVEGIRSGEADMDRRGTIDAAELHEWNCAWVRRTTQEHAPEKFGELPTGLWIAKSTASPLSPDLRARIAHPSSKVREEAVALLRALRLDGEPRAREAAGEALEELTRDRSERVGDAAREALGRRPRRPRRAAGPAPEPPEVISLIQRGERYRHSRRYSDALGAYDRVLERSPDNRDALVGRGEALLRLRRPPDALASLDRAIELDSDHVSARIVRAEARAREGRVEDALEDVEVALSLHPDSAEALAVRGEIAARMESPASATALESFEQALAIDPRNVDALVGRALCFTARGQWSAARKAVDEAIEADPRAPETRIGSAALHEARGKRRKAIEELDHALRLDPENVDALLMRGMNRLTAGHTREAMEDFEAALAIAPDDSAAHFGRGLSLVEQRDDGAALEAVERAVELGRAPGVWPRPELVLAVRGEVLLRLDRADEAERSFSEALEHDERFGRALAGRGRANLERGRPELAVRDLGRAVEIGADDGGELAELMADALALLAERPREHLPDDVAGEIDAARKLNQRVLAEAPIENGWLEGQSEAMSRHVTGHEQILWVGRCGRREDIQRHVALLLTSRQLVWCRQTWSSSPRTDSARWVDVRELLRLPNDGFRLVLETGRRVEFHRVSNPGADLTRGRLDLPGDDVRDLIARLVPS
ncbi:MAG TPA: tetratricopeptide repeat protein [Thermoleophilaceae bacterium]|jgi:tetratricopeptide (TPR) repeat protein